MKELFFGSFFAADKLNVVNNQNINIAVSLFISSILLLRIPQSMSLRNFSELT